MGISTSVESVDSDLYKKEIDGVNSFLMITYWMLKTLEVKFKRKKKKKKKITAKKPNLKEFFSLV